MIQFIRGQVLKYIKSMKYLQEFSNDIRIVNSYNANANDSGIEQENRHCANGCASCDHTAENSFGDVHNNQVNGI